MSNSRKRNLKKLARNIITGTALAAGGLSNTSAAKQQQPGVMTNAGLLTTAGLMAATVLGGGYFLTKKISERMDENKELQEKAVNWQKQSAEQKEEEIKRQNDSGINEPKIIQLTDYFNWQRAQYNKAQNVAPESVRQLVKECLDEKKSSQLVLLRDIAAGYDDNQFGDARFEGCRKAVFKYIGARLESKLHSKKILEAAKKLKENINNKVQLKNATVTLSKQGVRDHFRVTKLEIKSNDDFVIEMTGKSQNAMDRDPRDLPAGNDVVRVSTGQATMAHELAGDCFCPGKLIPFLKGCLHVSPVIFSPSVLRDKLGFVDFGANQGRDEILNRVTGSDVVKANIGNNKFFSGIMLHLDKFTDVHGIFIPLQDDVAGDRKIDGEVNNDIKEARKIISEVFLTGEGELNKVEAEKDGLEDY